MKNKLLFVVLAIMTIFVGASPLANAQNYSTLENNKAYVNSQIDTTQAVSLGLYNRADVYLRALDSISISKVYIDIKPHSAPTDANSPSTASFWAVQDSLAAFADTISYPNGGTYHIWNLRSPGTDKSPGVAVDTRFRIVFASSGNNGAAIKKKYTFVVDSR